MGRLCQYDKLSYYCPVLFVVIVIAVVILQKKSRQSRVLPWLWRELSGFFATSVMPVLYYRSFSMCVAGVSRDESESELGAVHLFYIAEGMSRNMSRNGHELLMDAVDDAVSLREEVLLKLEGGGNPVA